MLTRPVKILLIEDNPGDSRLIKEELSEVMDFLFDLTIAESLSRGLESAKSNATDVVLLDLSLPDSSGIDTFKTFHKNAEHIPIIILSGLKDETLASYAVTNGAYDYLVKGEIDSNILVRTINNAMEKQKTLEGIISSHEITTLTDTEGNILFANKAFEENTGYSLSEILNLKINILKSGHHTDTFYKDMWEKILSGIIYENTFINKKRNGDIYYENKTIYPIKNNTGEITHFISTGKIVINPSFNYDS